MGLVWDRSLVSCQGDLPRALPLLERAMGICQEAEPPALCPQGGCGPGAAYSLSGRVADAVALLTPAMEQTRATDMVGFQALCSLPLGEAQLLAGHLEEAQALAEQALALTRAHQELGNQAYALRLLGEIAARRDPPEVDLAAAHYQEALALADELGMRPLVAHCHRGLGTLYAAADQQARLALSCPLPSRCTGPWTWHSGCPRWRRHWRRWRGSKGGRGSPPAGVWSCFRAALRRNCRGLR